MKNNTPTAIQVAIHASRSGATRSLDKHDKQGGSFLIEAMVGMFVGVTGVMAMMFVMSRFEEQKRTTTEVTQALSQASLALFPIQHVAKTAGYGFTDNSISGCSVTAYNANATPPNYSFNLIPAQITAGADAKTSDAITF